MRLFFALLLDSHLKNHLTKEIMLLQKNCSEGNFTVRNNLHLTVEFIGEVNERGLDELKKILHSISFDAFEAQTTELGCFYNKASKAILYLGVKLTENLQELDILLRSKLIQKGYQIQDKPFVPHITIARKVKFKENFLLKTFEFPGMLMHFSKLSLMESVNIDDNLVYRELDHVDFKSK